MTASNILSKLDLRQSIKLVVYSLLLVNFSLYIGDDLEIASYTMRNGGSLLDWTRAFATTIDESAWFILLFLFELETYALSDEVQQRPGVTRLIHSVRLVCYLSLAHSFYAFGTMYFDLLQINAIEGVTNLCQLIGPDISFVRNLAYSELNEGNCQALSSATQFYFAEPDLVVTDGEGLALEKWLAMVDLLEVVFWMLILLTIEVMVRLQDKGTTTGALVTSIKGGKIIFYTALWGIAAYWVSLGHYYFAWDEALWIIGFIAIEMNMDEWKKEIEEDEKPASD